MIVNKGKMLTFAEGEYSDYCVEALVVVLVEFDLKQKQLEWELAQTEVKECSYRLRELRKVKGTAFLPWLVSKGLVEDVPYIEVHTGSYGESKIGFYEED